MFVEGVSGTLMDIRKSDQTSLGFKVWFPFVRSHMRVIREGSLAAVKNFSSDTETDRFSVVRITSVMPTHYAMMASRDGYPGFVEEAALSAARDWNQDRPIEDTTKIVCDAVPSRFEIRRTRSADGGGPEIGTDSNLPMPGERARLLDVEWTRRIINRDLQKQDSTVSIGTLANMDDVEILVLWDSVIRTHFGVFAYTNAGKSNLLSTVTSKIFAGAGPVKAVIYDLMGEYGILLADVLHYNDNARTVFLSPDAVPRSVLDFWRNPSQSTAAVAAGDIVKTTVLPKALVGKRESFAEPVRDMLVGGKFRLLLEDSETISDMLRDITGSADDSAATRNLLTSLSEYIEKESTVHNINNLVSQARNYKFRETSSARANNMRLNIISTLEGKLSSISETENIDQKYTISQGQIIRDLNRGSSSSLYIIQDSSDIIVRKFSYGLGDRMLRARRERGIISPPVSFIYDEADQFIAQDDKQQGMKESKQTAEQLARRGRKYGLGIGIATQRIVYLDTNILGQPHTYFVSKLPRASDREKIQEAFGLSDETLQESLRFNVGQWLLISHSATGIDGLPIPVQLPDANGRITDFLNRTSRYYRQ